MANLSKIIENLVSIQAGLESQMYGGDSVSGDGIYNGTIDNLQSWLNSQIEELKRLESRDEELKTALMALADKL